VGQKRIERKLMRLSYMDVQKQVEKIYLPLLFLAFTLLWFINTDTNILIIIKNKYGRNYFIKSFQ
jgi:hypothetical protein